MTRTIRCTHCEVELTLPDAASGRRLKCPNCGGKFYVGGPGSGGGVPIRPGSDGAAGPSSFLELSSQSREADLPRIEGDLHGTFEVPLLDDAKIPARRSVRETADVASLFNDAGTQARKLKPAEARAQARRCPGCGGVVAGGMSLCSTCGLDLDTGLRVQVDEVLEPPPEVSRGESTPVGVVLIGGVSLLGSVAMALLAFRFGEVGAFCLGLLCLFGIYASIQFLRGRSFKLLLVALSLGAAIDVIGLIIMPVVQASVDVQEIRKDANSPQTVESTEEPIAEVQIKPIEERLDYSMLWWGVALLVAYATVSFLILTPGFRRYYERR